MVGWVTGPNSPPYSSTLIVWPQGGERLLPCPLIFTLASNLQSVESKYLKGVVPEILSVGLWGQNNFHNSTETLLAFYTKVIFLLMMQRQHWVKLLMPKDASKPRHQSEPAVPVLLTARHSWSKKMPVSLQISWGGFNLWNLDACINAFLIVCVRKWEGSIKRLCHTPKQGRHLKGKHLCEWATFATERHFYLKEWLANYGYSDLWS